ncbi:MAG: DegV family protein [Actinomycetota bacterium]|jgi:DegV family protein with EDD domain|nr:DegV family protein [Actinomycetota bacterium]
MTTVHIVTDSSCDLPQEVVDELGITIVPLSIRFGDDEYIDRVELSTDEFWAKCAASETLPETAAPSPGAFERAYRDAAAAGATGVVAVVLSGDLSATIEAARSGARAVEDVVPVEVIDSRTVTLGLGTLVVLAAEAARAGDELATITTLVSEAAPRTRVHGALDTLDNLKKGGRIGAAQSLLGSLLSIKPLIEVRDGVVEPAGKQRTRGKALGYLVEQVRSNAANIERLAVLHAACDDVDVLVQQLDPLVDTSILVGQVGPVVGAHAGLGTIGVVFQVRN